jgi:hypothetical protein
VADLPTPFDAPPADHNGTGTAAHVEPHSDLAGLIANGIPGSVWLTGQVPSRDLRRGRYTPESMAHPGKMLPTIARYAIRTYTEPGDTVLDPMAGIGTTVAEAMRLGRRGVGVEYEPQWATHAANNVRLAERQGAPGRGEIYTGDARTLPDLLPAALRGQVALIVTSPPYGPSTHGHARTPGPRRGKVRKLNHKYGAVDNLAYRSQADLADGFTRILAGCLPLLRPGGHVVITARPYRRHGELIDIPGMVEAAGIAAGFELAEECIALICGVRDGVIVPRASFFQQKNVRDAIAAGDPQWLIQHEDVRVLQAHEPQSARRGSVSSGSAPGGAPSGTGLDASTPPRVDRRPQPAPPEIAGGHATAPPANLGRDAERTPDPCPPYPHPTPASGRTDATGHRPSADHDTPPPPPCSSDAAGRS